MLSDYLKALGCLATVGLIFSVLVYTGATIGMNIWLTLWSDDKTISKGGPDAKSQTDMRLGGYAAWGVLSSMYDRQV